MSPSWKKIPWAISRQRGLRRSRNSRAMLKCLNSSPWASRMMARASASVSTAIRCSYQPMASASSWRDVQIRAKVRMWSGRSPGGSWYWSVPNVSPPSQLFGDGLPLRDEYARVACPSGSLSFRRGGAGLTRLLGAGLTLHRRAPAGGASLRPPASTSVYRLRPTGGDVLHEGLQVQRGVEVPVDHQGARLAMEHPL